jgi:DNA-binding PadR family transcriptional regulator
MMDCGPPHRRHRRHSRRRRRSWRPTGRFFGPGEVRLALLSLLSERPQHGYELMKQLEERSGGMYRASAGTVYPTLAQLQDEGLVASDSEGGKRIYRLTDAGREELEESAETVEDIWQRAEQIGDWGEAFDPEVAELVRPALRLLRTVAKVATRRGDDPEVVDRVREILERAKDEIGELRRA